ncbi:MAG TPA: hypothetical protein VF711_12350 [Acidimicrobiales bacterium]
MTHHLKTVEEAYRSRASFGCAGLTDRRLGVHLRSNRRGEMDGVSDAIPLTGHRVTALADLLTAGTAY